MSAKTQPLTVLADSATLQAVRPEVQQLLESAPAFARLSPEERKQLASAMVKVSAYLANPEGVASAPATVSTARSLAQEDPVTATKRRLSQAPGFAGKDFQAGAVQQGVEQFGALVKKVDFPNFVSGLIQNVFQAIVDSSIQQMRAYGELLANVAKTVDQFAQDNITENNARDWMAQKFPDQLDIGVGQAPGSLAEGDTPPPQPRLVAKGDDPAAVAKNVSDALQLDKPISDLSDPDDEQRVVMAARLQMARGRQQLLSSMVMLGINRIVVTDGLIHAKVVFDMRASDVATRRARASMYDQQKEHFGMSAQTSIGGWFSPVSGSLSTEASTDHVATVESSVDETSESKAEVKANLTGEVRVNFKSDFLPMEKMATPEMIAAIQGNSKPLAKPVSNA